MGVTFTDFSDIPIPDKFGVDDLPYWFSQIFAVVDPALILYAADNDSRDSQFYLAQAGAVCVVVDSSSNVAGLYIKTSAPGTATWGTIWKAPAALNWVPLNLATDMEPLSVTPSICIDDSNRWATLKGDIQTISTATLINGTTIATIPNNFVVDGFAKLASSMQQVPTSWGAGYITIDPSTGAINTWGITASSGGIYQPQWVGLWTAHFACHSTS